MKRFAKIMACLLICVYMLPVQVFGRELVAVGQLVGLELQDGSVTVAAFDETLGAAARAAGLEVGDRIISINAKAIHSAEDVRNAVQSSKGMVQLCVKRGKEEIICKFAPEITADGPKLGLYLRQGITGVGTVTWYDPQTREFGALGHGVNDSAGKLLNMTRGTVYESAVMAVRKGKAGEPGQLMGCAASGIPIGQLQSNTNFGVFGTVNTAFDGKTVNTASWEEIRTGAATILSMVSGCEVREYSVEILKIYPKAGQSGRNLLIKVTDPALLETTGGIVQGMSGSPILQDGRIVGAVTHVLVNDPTTGYGIFIENMLDAAS